MPPGLQNFVTSQAARTQGQAANQRRQVDPDRAKQAQGARVNIVRIGRTNAPNTSQQRHENPRQEVLRHEQHAQRSAFHASEYEGSTVTSINPPLVLDSQVDTQGQPIGHPITPAENFDDHPEYQEEYEEAYEGSQRNGDDVEEDDEEEGSEARVMRAYMDDYEQEQSQIGVFDKKQTGDSYPPTTSGRPDLDEDEYEGPQQQLQKQYDASPSAFRHRGPLISGIEAPIHRPASQQAFQSQVSARPHMELQQTRHSQPQPAVGLSPVAQNRRMEHNKLVHRPHTPPMTKASQRTQLTYQQPIVPSFTSTRPATGMQSGYIKSPSNSGGSLRAPSQATIVQAQTAPEYVQPRVSLMETALDYDPEILNQKTYDELRTQAFDTSPSEHPSVLSEEDASKPISDRLVLVQEMDSAKKQEFMASLSLDEWDEAGDWFLERFGSILNKMKNARKERRKLAKEFEEEIFQRHESVQGKKRGIEEALGEMSKNGKSLLNSGTPKKARV